MRRAVVLLLILAACERENRRFRESPPTASPSELVTMSTLRPGERGPELVLRNVYEQNAWAVSEGKRLYSAFNCVGCHAHGGGGMGPPLLDDEWIYGSDPENVYSTIVQGRPNGMPSFGRRLSTTQVWQLVAYVRSLNGLMPADVRPARADHMSPRAPEQALETVQPRRSTTSRSSVQP